MERYSCLKLMLENSKHGEAGLNFSINLQGFIHDSGLKKIVFPLNVSLNYISCLDSLSKSLSYRFAACFQPYMNRVQ